jgi:hypothetical protein
MKFKTGDMVIFKFNNLPEQEGVIIGNTEQTNVYIVQFGNRTQNIISHYLTIKHNNNIDLYYYYQNPIDIEKIE